MRPAEYSLLDATALAAAVRSGDVTPERLHSLALEAIACLNPTINAVVETLSDEESVDRAAPFPGVPFLIKDLGATRVGVRSEFGSRLGEGLVGTFDGEIIARLRRAGFRLAGRSTVPEFAMRTTTESARHGATCSPWSEERIAGGSSGGAAAAVGSGMVPIAHGNDAGGSIRIPAACCGVIGLKPTRGRVSDAPHGSRVFGWSSEFALTKSVRDTAALLDCVSGRVPGDPFEIAQPDVPYIKTIDQDLRPLRVAVSTQPWSGLPADPELTAAARGLAAILENASCRVELRSPSFDWHDFARAELHITSMLHAAFLDAVASSTNRQVSPTTVEAHSYRVYQLGKALGPGALFDAFDAGDRVCRSIGQFFEEFDLLVTPTMPVLPALLGTFNGGIDDSPETIQNLWARHDTYTAPFNLTGQPAISVPFAVSRVGTPIGVQLVARFGREDLLLTASRLIEREMGWATRIPPLHVSRHDEPTSTPSSLRTTGS